MPELIRLLMSNVVLLQFTKVTDGRNRFAIATLDPRRYTYAFKGGTAPNVPGLYRYWDIALGEWRSFYLSNVGSYSVVPNR
jgi:hypothetical protein